MVSERKYARAFIKRVGFAGVIGEADDRAGVIGNIRGYRVM